MVAFILLIVTLIHTLNQVVQCKHISIIMFISEKYFHNSHWCKRSTTIQCSLYKFFIIIFYSFIHSKIYIAPLLGNHSEALPTIFILLLGQNIFTALPTWPTKYSFSHVDTIKECCCNPFVVLSPSLNRSTTRGWGHQRISCLDGLAIAKLLKPCCLVLVVWMNHASCRMVISACKIRWIHYLLFSYCWQYLGISLACITSRTLG